VDQFALAGLESFVDLPRPLGLAELAAEHGHELVPAAKTAGVAFALVATDDLFKHRPGNLLAKLAENAGYLRQGWGPRGAGVDSYGKRLPTRLPTRPGARPSARHANLDTSGSRTTLESPCGRRASLNRLLA
jgi:hypothetical protein